MVRKFGAISVIGAAVVTLAACTETIGYNAEMPTAASGAAFFADNCVSCHGDDGKGLGALSSDLPIAPADLTVLSRKNGGEFPKARALSYIYGDPENSHLARVMPEFGGAMEEDVVPVEIDGVQTPTPRELAGLLAYLESIQR